MSGPIIRKYGFPNFDKIFGERPLEHGLDDEVPAADLGSETAQAESIQKKPAKKKSTQSKKA